MGVVLKKDEAAVVEQLRKAAELGHAVAAEKGLEIFGDETPTPHQTGIAAIHAREDAAALVALVSIALVQQRKMLRWIKACTAISLLALLTTCSIESRAADRSRTIRAEFMRANPCPANGQTRGACPGYQVDHREALICGGKDELGNLQWLSIAEHREKTRVEVKLCRSRTR